MRATVTSIRIGRCTGDRTLLTRGQGKDPSDVDHVGIGEPVAVALDMSPIESVDLRPTVWVAQVSSGDSRQVLTCDNAMSAPWRVPSPAGKVRIAGARAGRIRSKGRG
ncbi:hypothetical protein Afe04nite_20790 [Asanoa ferruginea]|nr:hypothetical protein Afe04nite_20790 [Asanoa ferruginea]